MKFAIAGCGRAGRRHAKAYRQLEGVGLSGCYDASPAAASAFANEFETIAFKDLDAFLDAGFDGLSICTPPSTHIAIAAAAMRRGIQVFCEKPLAARTEQCRELRRDAALVSAFKFRHLTGAAILRDKIAAGQLGKIVSVRGTAVSSLDMTGSWFSEPKLSGGGVLLDNGVHLIDLCRYLLGPVAEATGLVSGGSRGLPVEETASLMLKMASGAAVHLLVSWETPAPMPPLLELHGTAGYARLGYELEIFDAAGKERVLHVPAGGVDIWHEVVASFVGVVQRKNDPSATLEDGFAALAAAEACYRSLHTGRWERPVHMHEVMG